MRGEVLYNDGNFAEIQTIGIEGIERDLLLGTVQIHRSDTDDAAAEFQRRFRIRTRLHISTTIEARIDYLRPDGMARKASMTTNKPRGVTVMGVTVRGGGAWSMLGALDSRLQVPKQII
jgi:hypothetical protein